LQEEQTVTPGSSSTQPRRRPRVPHFISDEVPLYYQLASVVREEIVTGVYGLGDRIPTEVDLVREYGLSRITVRQALHCLETDGLIRREPGRGTFVTDRQPIAGKLELNGTIDDLISMGQATSAKLLDISDIAATAEDAAVLEQEPGSALTRVTRVRYYNLEPYSFIINLLPVETGHKLDRNDLMHGSMLQFLEEKLLIPLHDAEQSVRATLANAKLARYLKTRIGAPLLFVKRVVRTNNSRPVMRTLTYYRSDVYSFVMHLTRDPRQAKTPGAGWALKAKK
jgi:GntR family transcriptional regulator